MDGIQWTRVRVREPRLAVRRFISPVRDVFTSRPDGSSWSKADHTLAVVPRYVEGLVSPGKGKHMRGLAKRVELPEDRVHRFISQSPWSHEELQDHLCRNIPDTIRGPSACLVIDEVGVVKDGSHSVGVHRQYSGAAGKVENCQVAVDLVYAAPGKDRNADQKTWPLGMELYLPEAWATDADRRREVGVPKNVVFRTKPRIALGMVEKARKAGVEYACVLADAVYGDPNDFRERLRSWGSPYALGVSPSKHRVIAADTPLEPAGPSGRQGQPPKRARYPARVRRRSPLDIAKGVKDWIEVSWGRGVKGPLKGLFHAERVRVVAGSSRRYATDEVVWLLLEKRGREFKAWFCWGVDDASLEELVSLAHFRWVVEQFHRDAKQELGVDEFEGRTWKGWNHHISMVLLAYAFIATLRAEQDGSRRLPFRQVVRALVYEIATQAAQEEGLDRATAKRVGARMVRRLTEW